MESPNCNWLEWEKLSSPVEFSVTETGDLPSGINRIKISRSENLELQVIGKGNWSECSQAKEREIGEVYNPKDIAGFTGFKEVVKLKGVTTERIEEAFLTNPPITVYATAYQLEVGQPNSLVDTHVEWLVNFSPNPDIFPRGTTRNWSYTRERIEGELVKYDFQGQFTSDYLQCQCNINSENLSLIIGKAPSNVISSNCHPGFIEFVNLQGQLPTENTLQSVLSALSFTFGRELIAIGSTSYNKDRKAACYSARQAIFSGDQSTTYKNPSFPPAPINSPQTSRLLDEDKISSIMSAFVNKMGDLDIEHPLQLMLIAQSSPITVKAAHLGAAIESLRDSYLKSVNANQNIILPKPIWKKLKEPLIKMFDAEKNKLDKHYQRDAEILKRNLLQINKTSSNMKYSDFFTAINLKTGEVEKKALKERNNPAHGYRYSSHQYAGLVQTTNALYTLFNRIILRLANAADYYIDYSTNGFPVRSLDEPLGGPANDGKPAEV